MTVVELKRIYYETTHEFTHGRSSESSRVGLKAFNVEHPPARHSELG